MVVKSLRTGKTTSELAEFYDSLVEKAGNTWQNGMIDPPHQQERVSKTIEFLSKQKDTYNKVLDLGCSYGLLTKRYSSIFPNGKITGVDISPKAIEYALEHNNEHNIEYICSDALEYLQRSEKYDIIVCTEVIEHVLDYDVLIKKVLELSDYALISVPVNESPNKDSFNLDKFGRETEIGDATGHIHHFTKESLSPYFSKVTDFWTNGIHMIIGGE